MLRLAVLVVLKDVPPPKTLVPFDQRHRCAAVTQQTRFTASPRRSHPRTASRSLPPTAFAGEHSCSSSRSSANRTVCPSEMGQGGEAEAENLSVRRPLSMRLSSCTKGGASLCAHPSVIIHCTVVHEEREYPIVIPFLPCAHTSFGQHWRFPRRSLDASQ